MKRISQIFLALTLTLQINLKAEAQKLTILHTSDTHSCIEPISKNDINPEQADKAGFIRRATLIEQLRKETPELLLLDCGDFSQGSVYYNLFHGEVEIKLMNQMRYDAATIGNHEFDYGLQNMARLFKMASFPIVCSNYDFDETPLKGLTQPYIILQRAGMRIGIIGVAPQLDGLVAKACYENTKYIDPVTAAQPIVDKLRENEHCDVIICLSHLGIQEDRRFIQQTHGIDVVLGGHSHTYLEYPMHLPNDQGHFVTLDHQGKNARFVGKIVLEW